MTLSNYCLFREQVDRTWLAVLSDSSSTYFQSDKDSSGTDDLAICAVTTVQMLLRVVMLCYSIELGSHLCGRVWQIV